MDIFVGVYQHAPSFLVIKGVSLEVLQSGEVSLYDPPPGPHREYGRAVVVLVDDLKASSELVDQPVPEPSVVATIGEYPPQPREPANLRSSLSMTAATHLLSWRLA